VKSLGAASSFLTTPFPHAAGHHCDGGNAGPAGIPGGAACLVDTDVLVSWTRSFQLARELVIARQQRALNLGIKNRCGADAYAAREALFLAQRDFTKAIADYTKAIERQPDEPLRYADRARALLESGDAKAALPDAERARSDAYGFAYPLLLRARIYLALGRRDDAVDDLRRAARLGPPPEDNDVSKEIRQRMGAGPGGDYTEGAAERELAGLGVALAQPPEPVRVAAPLPRGPCKAGQAPEEQAFAATTLSIEAGALRVGQPIRIRWTTPAGRRDAAKPTYLIVATPAAVRFAGSGFFALGPDAEGPA